MIHVYTDGACIQNGKQGAKASFAGWFPEKKELSFSKLLEDEQKTNQRAELKAIYESIKIAKENGYESIKIYTDSLYSKKCLTEWVEGWIKKNWKTTDGNDVKHRDLIEGSYELLKTFKEYSFVHVKAHTGNKDELSINNDIVDKMASKLLFEKIEEKDPEQLFPDLQLSFMGSPLEETKIIEWCKTHYELLDEHSFHSALFSAFQSTLKKNGIDSTIQQINKTRYLRISKNIVKL